MQTILGFCDLTKICSMSAFHTAFRNCVSILEKAHLHLMVIENLLCVTECILEPCDLTKSDSQYLPGPLFHLFIHSH